MSKFLIITIAGIFAAIWSYGQQQPENPGFETWENVGLNRPEPVDWSSIKTSDGGSIVNGFAPYVWDQSTDAHTGTYSIKLETGTVLGINAPGTVTNGRIHATLGGEGWAFTEPGNDLWSTPMTQKPDSVAIWVKNLPVGNDVAQVKALLHTGAAIIPDVTSANYVALAEIYIPNVITTWTRVSAPFNYFNSTDPEYILFVISTADESATLGSVAYFDDLELIYNDPVLDLTVFLEGPYTGNIEMGTGLNPDNIPLSQPYNTAPWNYGGSESVVSLPNPDIVDWVLVEIRDAASAAAATSLTTVGQQAAFLLKDGSIVGLDGMSRISFPVFINQNLYVVVKHRNHLAVMSNYAVEKTNGIHTYDFSNASDKIYGGSNGYTQLEFSEPELYGMTSGDGDANGIIEQGDKTNFWSILVGKSGYLASDYDLDGQTGNTDKNDAWLNNLTKESQVPN
ncbi:MAG: hypothetical protein R2750_11640 [Bacteroidales bacterium]